MRNSGAIEYITPLQRATESSTTPKSVMKTTVGGAFDPASCALATPTMLTSSRTSAAVLRECKRQITIA